MRPWSATPETRSSMTLREVCSRRVAGRKCSHGLEDISEVLRLLTDSEFADDLAITVCVTLLEVIEQASALADKHKQTTT